MKQPPLDRKLFVLSPQKDFMILAYRVQIKANLNLKIIFSKNETNLQISKI